MAVSIGVEQLSDSFVLVALLLLKTLEQRLGEPFRHLTTDVLEQRDTDVKVSSSSEPLSQPTEFDE